ncbi:unnamed protein product [Strongylus vulgaris]|uniref:Uncharacterized protein n=1 Tax=Strongylus vulgaris TaxID=40348 RepID=A0A3P7JZ77_STRVU|nr:unnamed protein product [Strongylus vulgaris]
MQTLKNFAGVFFHSIPTDERRRSLSKDSSATIIAELANLLNELKNVHTIMDTIKVR